MMCREYISEPKTQEFQEYLATFANKNNFDDHLDAFCVFYNGQLSTHAVLNRDANYYKLWEALGELLPNGITPIFYDIVGQVAVAEMPINVHDVTNQTNTNFVFFNIMEEASKLPSRATFDATWEQKQFDPIGYFEQICIMTKTGPSSNKTITITIDRKNQTTLNKWLRKHRTLKAFWQNINNILLINKKLEGSARKFNTSSF